MQCTHAHNDVQNKSFRFISGAEFGSQSAKSEFCLCQCECVCVCDQMSEECVDINRSFVLLAAARCGSTPYCLFVDFACAKLIVQIKM